MDWIIGRESAEPGSAGGKIAPDPQSIPWQRLYLSEREELGYGRDIPIGGRLLPGIESLSVYIRQHEYIIS